jgi:hypothetical protein
MCPFIPNQQINTGSFVESTNVFDASRFLEADINSEEFRQLLVKLTQNMNNVNIVLNSKVSGYNLTQEFITSKLYFNPTSTNPLLLRPSYLTVVNFGALPNAGTKSVPHNIDIASYTVAGVNPFSFTEVRGCATKPTTAGIGLNYIPLPYVSQTPGDSIELYADQTNVNVITASDYSAWTTCYIFLELLKN